MFFLSNILNKLYIIIVACIVMGTSSYAQDVLTLKQSVEQTIAHNAQLKAAMEGVYQAQENVDVAKGRHLPRVDMSAGWVNTNSPLQVFGSKLQQKNTTTADFSPNTLNNPSYKSNYQTRLGLSLPLFAGGALQAAQNEAESNAEAKTLEFEFHQQQQVYQTIVAYIQVKQLSEQLDISKKSVKAAIKHWQDTKALKNKGMVLGSDVMHAHVHVLRRQVIVDETSNMYLASLEHLALLMGSNKALKNVRLQNPSINIKTLTLDELAQQADEKRLDILALKARIQGVSFQRRKTYASDLPQVNLVAAEEWNSASLSPRNNNSMVGITVTMNIFNGGSDHAKQRSVEHAYNALQWQVIDKTQAIENEVKQAWRALQVAKKKLHREQQALEQTKESLRIQSLRYQQGLETTSNVLDAQVDFDTSQVREVRAQYDVALAKAALILASGDLNKGAVE